jgi:hypothetical protein
MSACSSQGDFTAKMLKMKLSQQTPKTRSKDEVPGPQLGHNMTTERHKHAI